MAKFEVLTGEDAEMAQKAGAQLEVWTEIAGWITKNWPIDEWNKGRIYRLAPKPPEKKRVPLPDLRVLAGAMLVWPDGVYVSIYDIHHDGQSLVAKGVCRSDTLRAEDLLADYHYDRGNGPQPCWTEEVEG